MRHSAVLILIMAVIAIGCKPCDAPENPQPTLSVADATDITRNDAVIVGSMADNGGKGLSDLQFEWWHDGGASSSSPSLTADKNSVEYALHGLKPGTTYYYILKGSNGRVEIESERKQFQTLPNVVPAISGLTVLAKGPTSIIASFNIEDNGGEDIVEAGCYIRNVGMGNETKLTAEVTGNTVYITIRGLEKNSDFEITPFSANTIGETRGTPLVMTTDNSITISEPGMVAALLGDDRMQHTSLTFSGFMNGDDIRTLREMGGIDFDGNDTQGQLADIDLTDVNLVEGGGNYIPSRYIIDNVVGYGMFGNLKNLRRIMLPNTVTTIEEQAFLGCSGLKTVTIPAEATSVTPSDGCTSLEEIRVSPANRNYKSIDGVLFNAAATSILWFPIGKDGDYSLPTGVATIGDYAFRNSRIASFTMGDNVTEMGMAAFWGSSVRKVMLSDNLAIIPQAAFQSCAELTEVRLGSATNFIGSFAFDGSPLADIYLPAVNPPVCADGAFNSSYDLFGRCRLHVPEGSISKYKLHPVWGKFIYISK